MSHSLTIQHSERNDVIIHNQQSPSRHRTTKHSHTHRGPITKKEKKYVMKSERDTKVQGKKWPRRTCLLSISSYGSLYIERNHAYGFFTYGGTRLRASAERKEEHTKRTRKPIRNAHAHQFIHSLSTNYAIFVQRRGKGKYASISDTTIAAVVPGLWRQCPHTRPTFCSCHGLSAYDARVIIVVIACMSARSENEGMGGGHTERETSTEPAI